MLVLTRKEGQAILIDGGIVIRIRRIRGKQVSITVAAPQEITIVREELAAGAGAGEVEGRIPSDHSHRDFTNPGEFR